MDVKERGWGHEMDLSGSGWGKWWDILTAVMNLWVTGNSECLG
jgi:hypothetical protein